MKEKCSEPCLACNEPSIIANFVEHLLCVSTLQRFSHLIFTAVSWGGLAISPVLHRRKLRHRDITLSNLPKVPQLANDGAWAQM